jgi:hypothetical protein
MNCYNCGIELTAATNHVEHIPAKNIFATYPPKYKQQLVTVPACFDCNNDFSKIDQEIRDAIGIMNDKNDLQNEMTRKSVKSIMRKSNWVNRVVSTDDGKAFEVSFSYDDFKKLHIKNFKGLFYHKYGFPLPKEYQVEIIAEGDEEHEKLQNIAKFLYGYTDEGIKWNSIGHEDVFEYKIKSMIADKNGMIYDDENIEHAIGFVCIMHYHHSIKPLIIASRTDFINEK